MTSHVRPNGIAELEFSSRTLEFVDMSRFTDHAFKLGSSWSTKRTMHRGWESELVVEVRLLKCDEHDDRRRVHSLGGQMKHHQPQDDCVSRMEREVRDAR